MTIRTLHAGDAGDKALMEAFFAQMLYSACGFKRLGNHSSGEVLFFWRVPMPMPAPAAQ